jgi:hypothetical protein
LETFECLAPGFPLSRERTERKCHRSCLPHCSLVGWAKALALPFRATIPIVRRAHASQTVANERKNAWARRTIGLVMDERRCQRLCPPYETGDMNADRATSSVRPRGSGGPDLETFACLALDPRFRGTNGRYFARRGKTKPVDMRHPRSVARYPSRRHPWQQRQCIAGSPQTPSCAKLG